MNPTSGTNLDNYPQIFPFLDEFVYLYLLYFTHSQTLESWGIISRIRVKAGEWEMEGNSGGGGVGIGGTTAGGVAAGGVTGGGGGNDVELMCKTLQVEHKLFYFDLKENPRGRYLKISEKTSATRSTIIVPFSGIPWFLDLFNYYINSDDPEVFSKELQLDTKASLSLYLLSLFIFFLLAFWYISLLLWSTFCFLCTYGAFQVFYFDIGENRRGRFLKVNCFPCYPFCCCLFSRDSNFLEFPNYFFLESTLSSLSV